MQLNSNQEIVGILHSVEKEDACCKLKFTCTKEIELPSNAVQLQQLMSLVGRRIGVFNYDGTYLVRVIKSDNSPSIEH